MKIFLPWLIFIGSASILLAQPDDIVIQQNDEGHKLIVNGKDFMINGMNWDYFPIGTNYTFILWEQTDDFIKAALEAEMTLLEEMGVNAIRVYTGIQPKWIEYIFDNYGIHTMLNHSFGRYGLTIDGDWVGQTDYADPRVRELLLSEVKELAVTFRNTRGLLLYLLGNENNYGLFWEGAETENIPIEDRNSTKRARAMYRLFNEAAQLMHTHDTAHPVAICNGDLQFLNVIIEECPDIDIFGTNIYRGVSFGDAFQRIADEYHKPILLTEFGADAFNSKKNVEDQEAQGLYLTNNWQEIYENAAGLGKANNSIGGFTFQFSDGWWKYGQTNNLDIHDVTASWSNQGYNHDFVTGMHNMNEEWFGICAKGQSNEKGLYTLHPRKAYFILKVVHQLNPYQKDMTVHLIQRFFSKFNVGN